MVYLETELRRSHFDCCKPRTGQRRPGQVPEGIPLALALLLRLFGWPSFASEVWTHY